MFVEVTVNPSAANLPFILLDSILFTTNGNLQKVILQAYGQNAHFFNADSIESNTVWHNDLPYVILNYLQVKPGVSLAMDAGCTVYFGGGAALIVEGDLNINGTDTAHMVTFRGVRLDKDIADRPYDDFPGQYAGLFFLRNSTGDIKYLKMRNSSYGINVGNIKTSDNPADNIAQLQGMNLSNAPNISINNSKIYNNAFYGIFGFLGKINGKNLLVYNCGKNVVGLYDGGDYEFTNCTFYTRGSTYISHTKDPALYMNNYFKYDIAQPAILADTAKALFTNCILFGTLEEEIVAEEETSNQHKIDLLFRNSVLKTKSITGPVFDLCKTEDPQFIDIFKSNYKLKAVSPCIDFSNPVFFTSFDIDNFPISGSKRDCGAYEFQ